MVTFRGDTPLLVIVIVAPPVLPPGLGVGDVVLLPPPQAVAAKAAAARQVRTLALLDSDRAMQGRVPIIQVIVKPAAASHYEILRRTALAGLDSADVDLRTLGVLRMRIR